MKPKDFVEKFKLDISSEEFDQKEFIVDFEMEFASLLQVGKAKENIAGYENAVRALRMKWDAISDKSKDGLPEKLWKFIFATTIAPTRDALFPEEMKKRKEQKAKRERYRRQQQEWEESAGRDFFEDVFSNLMGFLLGQTKTPIQEFSLFSLNPETANIEDVQGAFRQAALKCHSDVGGTDAQMMEILDARKKCLEYLTRNHR